MPSVALVVLRSIFVMVAVGMGVALINSNTLPPDPAWIPFAVIATCLAVSGSVIALDVILGANVWKPCRPCISAWSSGCS